MTDEREMTVAPHQPLTQSDLDVQGCDNPDCKEDHGDLYLHASCHLHGGLDVCYNKASGCMLVECHVCGSHVATIIVSSKPMGKAQ